MGIGFIIGPCKNIRFKAVSAIISWNIVQAFNQLLYYVVCLWKRFHIVMLVEGYRLQFCVILWLHNQIHVNSDMTDPVGPGKLLRHIQNPSYAYDGLSPVRHMQVCMLLHWGPHLISIKVKRAKEYAWLDFYYTCICLLQEQPDGANWVLSGRPYLSTCDSLGGNKPSARHVFVRHTQC